MRCKANEDGDKDHSKGYNKAYQTSLLQQIEALTLMNMARDARCSSSAAALQAVSAIAIIHLSLLQLGVYLFCNTTKICKCDLCGSRVGLVRVGMSFRWSRNELIAPPGSEDEGEPPECCCSAAAMKDMRDALCALGTCKLGKIKQLVVEPVVKRVALYVTIRSIYDQQYCHAPNGWSAE